MLRALLGLQHMGITDCEIMKKIANAQKNNLDEVEFVTQKGEVVRLSLPHLTFDPLMDAPDSW